MKLKNLLPAALCCALLAGCGGRSRGEGSAVIVDFENYVERPLAEAPEFHTGKRYVALHAEEQRLMIGRPGKVVLREDKIYVSEAFAGAGDDQRLVVHDDAGRALTNFGNQGRGPGEYLQITDYDVDAAGRVHIYDGNYTSQAILIYSSDGRFEEQKKLPFAVKKMLCTADGGYIFVLSERDSSPHAGRMFVRTDGDLNVLGSAGEWNLEQIDQNIGLGAGSLVATPEGTFFQQTPDQTIYRIDDEGNIAGEITMEAGRFAIPPENRGDLLPVIEEGKVLRFRLLQDFAAPWGGWIFGTMFDRGTTRSFAYDTASGINYTEEVPGGGFNNITDGRLVAEVAFDGENPPADLPAELREGVMAGEPLLLFYELK